MSRFVAAVAAGLTVALPVHAKGPAPKAALHPPPLPGAPRVWVRPAAPLPMLPSLSRVRLEVARDRLVVLEDVALPRGTWSAGGLDLHVAFGAPGTPSAVDAQIGPESSGAGQGDARNGERTSAISVEPAPGAVGGAHPFLGGARMAGVILRIKEAQLRRAFASSEVALLRIRSLLGLPPPGADGMRDVVVRLGAPEGTPLTLNRVQVVTLEPAPWILRAEANLCGGDADPWPLSVALLPKPERPAASAARPIAPALAARHATDDLCIRWWSSDGR